MFKATKSEVYSILVTWIRFLSEQWREIDIWPERYLVRLFSPSGFKEKFPTTRVVVEGMEFLVKKPKVPAAQQVTFSA